MVTNPSSKYCFAPRMIDHDISVTCTNEISRNIDICHNVIFTSGYNNAIHIFAYTSHVDSGDRYGPQQQ